jgi:hypothetical protein
MRFTYQGKLRLSDAAQRARSLESRLRMATNWASITSDLASGVVPGTPALGTRLTEFQGVATPLSPHAIDRAREVGIAQGEWGTPTSFVPPMEATRDAATPLVSAENVQQLLTCLSGGDYSGQERRRHQRHAVTAPVVALPLAADYHIDGDSVRMTTTNLSLGGAALIHTEPINAPYLVLDFSAAGEELLQVVLQILRMRSIGAFFEIGGQFIGRLPQPPA